MEIESDSFPFRRLTDGFTLRGVGLHSGRDCVLTVEPHDGEPVLRHEGAELPLEILDEAGLEVEILEEVGSEVEILDEAGSEVKLP